MFCDATQIVELSVAILSFSVGELRFRNLFATAAVSALMQKCFDSEPQVLVLPIFFFI